MKVVIQIPCFDEERTLPLTLAELPRELPGVDEVEWLVVDDGSSDRTGEVAREHGVDHVIVHHGNKGLATAFQTGLDAALGLGADIVVNTDGDNQYPGRYVEDLVAPILAGDADVVIGDRQTDRIEHFSPLKKLLQRTGSAVVRIVSGTTVPDAPSGFRAFSREAALRMTVLTEYTYTLDTIIQAGKKNLTVAHVPIETNPQSRESRLIRSTGSYVVRSAATILRLFALYEPLRTFTWVSLPFFLGGAFLWVRYLVLMITGEVTRGSNVQSVIVGAAALTMGFLIFLIGLLADIVATGRRINEEALYHAKKASMGGGSGQGSSAPTVPQPAPGHGGSAESAPGRG